MPADLTREEIDAMQDRLATDGDPTHDDMWVLLDYARAVPTRIEAARQDGRQEGYREGVEAIATALRREIPTGDGSTRSLTWNEASDAVDAIRAISPPPAEPSAPVAEPITPEEVMQVARGVKREAEGAAAARITALEAENAALRAKMAEADRALAPFAGIGAWLFARDLPDVMPLVDLLGINGASGVLTRGHFKAAHTARALLQGQGGGDAATV